MNMIAEVFPVEAEPLFLQRDNGTSLLIIKVLVCLIPPNNVLADA